jgi:hypothetical protein
MGVRAAQGGTAAALCERDRGHGEWLVSSGLPRGETDKSICTGKAAKGRLLSQKPINTVFCVKKHGWRGSKGGRLRHAFFLDQVKIQTLRARRSSKVCLATQPAQKLEELIVNAPVTVGDNHTGTTMSTVELVVQGLSQLVLVHGLLTLYSQGILGQPICEVQAEVMAPVGEWQGPDPVKGNFFEGVLGQGDGGGGKGAWPQGLMSWHAQQLRT